MCGPIQLDIPDDMKPPEDVLAKLIYGGLGAAVSASHVKCFVLLNWDKLTSLAHKIHDQSDPKKIDQP